MNEEQSPVVVLRHVENYERDAVNVALSEWDDEWTMFFTRPPESTTSRGSNLIPEVFSVARRILRPIDFLFNCVQTREFCQLKRLT